jgi:S1-C subfamily serine protease
MAPMQIVCAACKSVFAVELQKTPKQAFCPECGLTCRVPAAGEPADGWHYARGGKKIGPVSFDQLQQMAVAGELQPVDMVLQVGTNKWLPAKEVAGLSFTPSPPNAATPTKTESQASDNSTVATAATPVTSTQPSQRGGTWPKVILIGAGGLVALLMVTCCGTLCWLVIVPTNRPTANPKETAKAGQSLITAASSEEDIARAVGLVITGDRWTKIATGESDEVAFGTGTCFAVSAQGHLLTNRHVVADIWRWLHSPEDQASQEHMRKNQGLDCPVVVWVFFGKERHEATILHVSDSYDLAILKVDKRSAPFFGLSRSDKPARETKVIAYGFPAAAETPLSKEEAREKVVRQLIGKKVQDFFKARDFDFTATGGVVSRVNTEQSGRKWVQHNAPINPGNSGGPLVSPERVVLGINSLGSQEAQGIFNALSVIQLKQEIERHVPGAMWK